MTPDEALELERRLKTDAAAAEEFMHLMRIHLDLAEYAGPVRAFSVDELRAIKAVDDRFDSRLADSTPNVSAAAGERRSSRWWMSAFSIAAMALIAVSVFSLWPGDSGSQPSNEKPQVARQPSASAPGVVAHVRRKIDCDWSDDRWTVATSSQIAQGQLITLNKGLLVLEFKSGAEVTLNGPATLVAISDKRAKLVKGELSARVPPQARGFRVETHAGDFVDLGTQFGLLVAENGDVETHVFEGQVVAEPAPMGGQPSNQALLETGHAWARPVAGDIETGIAAVPGKFLLPLHEEAVANLALPPVGRNLSLWFAADSLVQRDAAGCVTKWGDITAPSNARRENAWQVTSFKRPKWIAKSIGGKPALRFDGYKGLVTEPLKLGPSQSAAIVFRVDGDVARELIEERNEFRELGVQLLNLNGPPHTVVQVNGNLSLEARVHLGFLPDQVAPVDVGRVRTKKQLDNNQHVLVYSFDTENALAQLYLDGDLVDQTTNVPKLDATSAPRYIGSHYGRKGFGFTGEIAEVLIYDGALTPNESRDVSASLGDKYGIIVEHDESSGCVAERGN